MDFSEIFLEFGALCLGNGACSDVACVVVAVNEAFTANPRPAGANEDGVVPLGAIRQAFSCKILPPVFAFLYQKFSDGGGVLDDAISSGFVRFPFLSLSLLLAVEPRRGIEFRQWVLGRGFDEVGREDHVEGAIHDHLKDLVKGYEAVVDHRAVAKFLALCQPTLNSDFHRVEYLCWKVNVSSNAPFANYLLHLDCVGKRVDPGVKRAACAK